MTAPSFELIDLAWQQGERVLTPTAGVLILLGVSAKRHGRHLRPNNDFCLAVTLTRARHR
jgi:hypothetical protein